MCYMVKTDIFITRNQRLVETRKWKKVSIVRKIIRRGRETLDLEVADPDPNSDSDPGVQPSKKLSQSEKHSVISLPSVRKWVRWMNCFLVWCVWCDECINVTGFSGVLMSSFTST